MKIDLRAHDPVWAEQFLSLRADLTEMLGDRALLLEHVGSTSVPGLRAKPILDLLLVVTDSADENAYAGHVEACGYALHHREPDWYEHRMFTRCAPDANLHVFSAGCEEIDRMIGFRDLLRRDAGALARYEREKLSLAERDWPTVQDYADAKADVVTRLLHAG